MGRQMECRLLRNGRILSGTAMLETGYLLFRGEERIQVDLKSATEVTARDGVLRVASPDGIREFVLGDAAEKWAERILHPPSRAAKLGIRPGASISLVGEFDEEFRREAAPSAAGATSADLLFFAARRASDLRQVSRLARRIDDAGALWVVYPKGAAEIREIEVLEAGRSAGLKDVKVVAFSATHTALKFVVPVAKRAKSAARG
jgi:hypothetical protein